MAKNSKSTMKINSLILIVIGAGLAFWGYQKSEGFESRVSSVLTGSNTDMVMILYILAAVCLVAGFYLFRKNK